VSCSEIPSLDMDLFANPANNARLLQDVLENPVASFTDDQSERDTSDYIVPPQEPSEVDLKALLDENRDLASVFLSDLEEYEAQESKKRLSHPSLAMKDVKLTQKDERYGPFSPIKDVNLEENRDESSHLPVEDRSEHMKSTHGDLTDDDVTNKISDVTGLQHLLDLIERLERKRDNDNE